MILRSYLAGIKEGLRDFPAVALLGPRQIGKSTLARNLVESSRKKALFLDIEKPSDRSKLADAEAFFKTYRDQLIVIDEVQFMPELFSVLRPVIDEQRKPGRFLLLGSASPQLVKGVSESLAGRIRYLELPPVSVLEASKNKIEMIPLWIRGGFQVSLIDPHPPLSLLWRKELIRSFVERDLTALFGTSISETTIRNFWQMLAHTQGSIFNAQTFAISLGVTGPTIKRYLQFLQGAFLVRVLEPWFVNTTKRLVKSPKVYVRDSGLLHALLDIETHTMLLGHPIAGFSWEGFAIEQIIQQLPDGLRPFFYRTHHGAEVDLVLIRGVKPIAAIEIKLTNAPIISRGFYEALKDLDLQKGYIITPGSDTYSQKQMQVISLIEFIEKVLPKLK